MFVSLPKFPFLLSLSISAQVGGDAEVTQEIEKACGK